MSRFAPLAALALLAALLLPSTAATAGVPPPTGRTDLRAYHGLGTWVDGWDYSRELAGSNPSVTAGSIPAMKSLGVATLYLQAAREDSRTPNQLMSPDRLGAILQAAHNAGIRVVAWYLPKFANPSRDWWHVSGMLSFSYKGHRFDSIGIDIEDTAVPVKTRNDRLVALTRLTRSKTTRPLSAIILPPVLTEIIRPTYWGGAFPWWSLRPSFDVWVPMGYYTAYSKWPQWRDAWNATREDIRRIRYRLKSNVPIHYVGGLAAPSSVTDYKRFLAGTRYGGAIGASAYDYATTQSWAWYYLRAGTPR
jgi:hypothetical protein